MFRLLKLEERIVLDGAAAFDLLDEMADRDFHDQMAEAAAEAHENAEGPFEIHEPLDGGALDAVAPDDGGLHVLLVSSDVKGADDLADAAKDGVVVLKYNAAETDLDELSGLIEDALDGQKADSIAIAAHNVNGAQVQLTNGDTASLDSLDTDAQRDFWKGLGKSLAKDGRIDLLSCDVAGAENGDAFLAKLEGLTKANVAASTDATGNEAFGGDWVLESEGVDIQSTYFDADKLSSFDDLLYAGQDPDPGYNDIYDRTVPSGKYSFIPVPTDTWQDAQGTSTVSLSFANVPSWMTYSASSEGFWALKPQAGLSATVTITASDGVNSVQDDFTVSAYDNALTPPSYPDVTANFTVSEDATAGQVVPAADYQIATDDNDATLTYSIVSGNPTDGTNFGFSIDGGTGDIVVSDGSLINFADPYVVNSTHQLVVRAEDDVDGAFAFSTVEIEMLQGAQNFEVDLSVAPTFLQEDPAGTNTAQITVNIAPTPTAPVTINLDFQGSGTDPATGPGTAPGDDYSVSSTSVSFAAGQSSQAVTLTTADDGVNEPNENFTVDIDPTGLPSNYSVATGALTSLTITDDVKPTVALDLAPASFGEDATATLTASLVGGVTVSTDTAIDLSFAGTAVHGAVADPGVNDYTGAEAITIPAGATSASITLTGVVDNIDEGGSEPFSVSIVDAPANTFNIDPTNGTASGSVTDVVVELPTVRLSSNRASFSEGETFQITAFLEDSGGAPIAAPAGGLEVILDNSGGTATSPDDFKVPSVISIAEGFTSNDVTVFGVADGITEGDETVGVAAAASAEYNVGSSPFTVILQDVVTPVVTLEGGGTINEDPAGTTIVQAVQSTTATTSTTVTLDITGNPAADRDVDYTAVYTSDNTAVATTPNGDWTVVIPANTTQAGIKITAITDGVFDGTENEQVVLTATAAGTSLLGTPDTATVEIVDADSGDAPVVNLFVRDGTQIVSDGVLDEAPGTIMNGQVRLPTGEVPPEPVTVYLTPSDLTGEGLAGVDYELYSDSAGTVTIPMEDIGGGVMAWPVTIGDGFNKANFYVAGLGDDNIFEGTETFNLNIADIVNGTVGTADTITAAINDATAAPLITLAMNPLEIQEQAAFGTHEATVTVDLTAAGGTTFGTGEATVSLSQIGPATSAAAEDVDYALFESDGTTPIPFDTVSGEWALTVDLTGGGTATGTYILQGQADELVEGTEGFTLEARIDANFDTTSGSIIDGAAADPLDVTLDAITTTSVTEGVGSAQVDFTLSRVYNADLVVTLDFGGTADPTADYFVEYADGTATVTETVGADNQFLFTVAEGSGTAAGFAVKAVNDGVFEGSEDFSITIGGLSAVTPPNTFSTNVETVTIQDGLPEPEISLFWKDGTGNPADTGSISEPGARFLFAALENPTSEDVVVDLAYTAPAVDGAIFGTDYTGTASISILAGQTMGETLISVFDDPLYEPDPETFNVSIAGFTGPAVDATPDQVTGIINASDLDGAVQVTLEWQNTGSLTEGQTGEDGVVVQLDRDTHTTDVVVTLQFGPASPAVGDAAFTADYDTESGTAIDGTGQLQVTVPVGATQTTVPLVAIDDTFAEPPTEGFSVDIAAVAGGVVAGNPAEEFGTQTLTGVVVDNEPSPEINIELLNSANVEEAGGLAGAAQFRAVITNGVLSTEDISVTLDVTDGTLPGFATQTVDFNGSPNPPVLTIPAGEIRSGVLDATSGIFRVIPVDDNVFEGDESLDVGVSEAVGALSGATFPVNTATQGVTIVDDEVAPTVSITPATDIITELPADTAALTLALSGDSFTDVVVTLQIADIADGGFNTDYELFVDGSQVLTLGAGDTFTATFSGGVATPINVDISTLDDGTIEGDEALSVEIVDVTNATIGTQSLAAVTIADDDFPTVYVDLAFEDTGGNVDPNAQVSEDPNVFGARVAKLDVNLVDALGAAATLPAGSDAIVTLDFFGAATPDDNVVADFDYEIATDQFFNNIVTVSTTGELDVTVPAEFGTTTLYVRGANDTIYEGDESLEISAIGAVNAVVDPAEGDTGVSGAVLDDDNPPTVVVSAATPAGVTEGLTTEFTVTFQDRSSVDTEVTLSFGGDATIPDDYALEVSGLSSTFAGGALTFTAPATDLINAGASFTVLAKTVDETLYEADESIVLNLQPGTDYSVGATDTATSLILNDDAAPFVSLGTATPAAFSEDTGSSVISVELRDQAGASVSTGVDAKVTIDFGGAAIPAETAPVGADDYTVLVDGAGVTFSDANTLVVTIAAGSTQAALTIDGVADGVFEADEDVTVSIVGAADAVPSTPVDAVTETAVILNDDGAPAVSISWANPTFGEDSGTNTLIADFDGVATLGADATVTLTFGGAATYTPGSAFAGGDDVTDASTNANVITIAAGASTGSLTFFGIADDKYEADTITGTLGEDFVATIAGIDIEGSPASAGATSVATAIIIDDPADVPQVSLDVVPAAVTEGDSAEITVTRDKTAPVDTVVDLVFTTTGADPVEDGDFSAGGASFATPSLTVSATIPAGQTSATVNFDALTDLIFEGDETVSVQVVPTENGTLGVTTSATVTIIDDGGATPVVSLTDQAAGGVLGNSTFAEVEFFDGAATIPNTASFTVALDSGAFDPRAITLQLGGAADATVGPDYTVQVDPDGVSGPATLSAVSVAADGSFSFTLPAGFTSADVVFTGVEDTFYETPESLNVAIADADGLQVSAGADSFTYTLWDDDPAPVVELSLTVSELPENGGATSMFALLKDPVTGAAFTAQTDVIVEVTYGGDAGLNVDYTTTAAQFITIAEGNDKSAGVFLETIDDTVYEANEIIDVSIVNAANATVGAADAVSATIVEDEQGPTVSLTVDTTVIQEASGEAAMTLGLSFTSPVDEKVWVNFTTTEDDSVGDSATDVWGTEARYDIGFNLWPADYLGTDQSGFSTFPAEIPLGNTLPVETNPNTGQLAFAITIPAGAPSQTVYLHALNDNSTLLGDEFLFEKDETFAVSIDANSFPNNLQVDTANAGATVTILDDDEALAPNVNLAWNVGGGFYSESGSPDPNTGSLNVSLDSATNQLVQVTLDMNGQPEDYTVGLASPGTLADNGDGTFTLTFPTAAAAQTSTVTFSIVDDGTYEIEESFTVAVQDVVFAKLGTSDILTGVITDEGDAPQITVEVSTDGDLIPEGTLGTVSEGDLAAGPDTLFVIDKGGVTTGQPVLVDYIIGSSVTDGAEAGVDFNAITSGTVTLARDFDAIAAVDLSVIGDDLDENDEDVFITISNARFEDGTPLSNSITAPGDVATLIIADDDFTPVVATDVTLGVSEGAFGTITDGFLQYTDDDSVDDDLVYEVVTAPASGTIYLGTPGDVTNSAALGAGDFFFQSDLTTASTTPLWYQHDDSETTSDSFVYTVTDGLNTSPQATFDIDVAPVNDAPEVESIVFYMAENATGEVSDLVDGTGDGLILSDQDGDALTASITIGDTATFSLDTSVAGEVRLNVDAALDYEFQSSHALLVNVSDPAGPAQDVMVVVNVKDVLEPDEFAAGTIPTPDVLASDSQWVFMIPDSVFPDGQLVTYKFVETTGLNTSPWLNFESEAQTFWYDPAINPGPAADQVYNIEITATYWQDNQVIKGVSQASFDLTYDFIASLQRSGDVFEALDFLETEDGEFFLPEDGDAVEIQEMMVARAVAPADGAEVLQAPAAEETELAEVLALLEGDPLSPTPEERGADVA